MSDVLLAFQAHKDYDRHSISRHGLDLLVSQHTLDEVYNIDCNEHRADSYFLNGKRRHVQTPELLDLRPQKWHKLKQANRVFLAGINDKGYVHNMLVQLIEQTRRPTTFVVPLFALFERRGDEVVPFEHILRNHSNNYYRMLTDVIEQYTNRSVNSCIRHVEHGKEPSIPQAHDRSQLVIQAMMPLRIGVQPYGGRFEQYAD